MSEMVTIQKEKYFVMISMILGAYCHEGREEEAANFMACVFDGDEALMEEYQTWFAKRHEGEKC
jgi:hypothetical protein